MNGMHKFVQRWQQEPGRVLVVERQLCLSSCSLRAMVRAGTWQVILFLPHLQLKQPFLPEGGPASPQHALGQSASEVAIQWEALGHPFFPRRESGPQETPTMDAAKFRVRWGNTSLARHPDTGLLQSHLPHRLRQVDHKLEIKACLNSKGVQRFKASLDNLARLSQSER